LAEYLNKSERRGMRKAKPGDPNVVVAYLRVSTDEQKIGPEAQRAAIEAWAAREGARVVAWHEDLGVSGSSEIDERRGLIAAISSLRTHGAGTLVVAKRDRLARDVAVSVLIERAVRESGARVASADGVANGDGAADAFLRAILDAAAAYERELIRARTRAAMAVKRAKGERSGKIPYGLALAQDGRHLVEDAFEQSVIARAKGLRSEGHAVTRIAKALDALGVPTRAGRPWHPQQVARMLR
jgi:DNA invertase Pin-like site-specific DNA recombinase